MKARSLLRLPVIRLSPSDPQASQPASIVVVNVRDLARQTSKLVDEVQNNGLAVLITRHGVPVATLTPIDEEDLERFTRANAAHLPSIKATGDAPRDESHLVGEAHGSETRDHEEEEPPKRPEPQGDLGDERRAERESSSVLGGLVARARRVTRTSR